MTGEEASRLLARRQWPLLQRPPAIDHALQGRAIGNQDPVALARDPVPA
jgi:hypothetical protein